MHKCAGSERQKGVIGRHRRHTSVGGLPQAVLARRGSARLTMSNEILENSSEERRVHVSVE